MPVADFERIIKTVLDNQAELKVLVKELTTQIDAMNAEIVEMGKFIAKLKVKAK